MKGFIKRKALNVKAATLPKVTKLLLISTSRICVVKHLNAANVIIKVEHTQTYKYTKETYMTGFVSLVLNVTTRLHRKPI